MADRSPILVAVDGSVQASRALAFAGELARAHDRPLLVATVVPPPPVYPGDAVPLAYEPPDAVQSFQATLDRAVAEARATGLREVAGQLRQGPIVDELVDLAKEVSPWMIVMGARGLSRGARLFLGSVSDGVVHHAPCPVLIVRGVAKG